MPDSDVNLYLEEIDVLIQQGFFEKADSLLKIYFDTTNETELSEPLRIKYLRMKGRLKYLVGEYKESLEWYSNILVLTSQAEYLGYAYSGLASNYLELGDYNLAIKNNLEALYWRKRALEIDPINKDNQRLLVGTYANIGENYRKAGALDQAYEYLTQGVQLGEKYEQKIPLIYVYQILAVLAENIGHYREAEEHYGTVLTLAKQNKNILHQILALSNLSYLYNRHKDPRDALKYAIECWELIEKSEVRDGPVFIYAVINSVETLDRNFRPVEAIKILNQVAVDTIKNPHLIRKIKIATLRTLYLLWVPGEEILEELTFLLYQQTTLEGIYDVFFEIGVIQTKSIDSPLIIQKILPWVLYAENIAKKQNYITILAELVSVRTILLALITNSKENILEMVKELDSFINNPVISLEIKELIQESKKKLSILELYLDTSEEDYQYIHEIISPNDFLAYLRTLKDITSKVYGDKIK